MKAAVAAAKDLDTSVIVRQNEVSKSQADQLTRDRLLEIARSLAIHICDLHFNMKRCHGCTVKDLIEQLGLCDREDLDKQDEEMRKRKAKVSKSRTQGFSVYFVPCYCHTCGHRCSNVYGPYFKMRTPGGSMNMNLDLQSPEVQKKVRQAALAYRRSHPSALLPWDPGWTSHKHSHSEKDLDTHSRMDRKPLVSKSQARG